MRLECPGRNLHRYHEEEDETVCYALNPRLIKAIRQRGWILGPKIGEGALSDVFSVEDLNGDAGGVLILFANTGFEGRNIDEKIDRIEAFPAVFPRIYDHFALDIPYSTAARYLESSGNFGDRTIQVMERVIPLDRYLIEVSKLPHPEYALTALGSLIRTELLHHLTVLYRDDITYTDVKIENMGITIQGRMSHLKLIDIEGVHLERWEGFHPERQVSDFFKYLLNPLLAELISESTI